MVTSQPARTDRRRSAVVTTSMVAVAALVVFGAYLVQGPSEDSTRSATQTTAQVTSASPSAPSSTSSSSPAAPSQPTTPPDTVALLPEAPDPGTTLSGGPVGAADGVIGDGVTVFRDDVIGVANLNPVFLAVLRRAATDAADDGVQFTIHSAWRSQAYQERLLQDAIAQHGSAEAAAPWVAPSDKSAHVFGDAIDLESPAAMWLSEHGAAYGLCQIYDNEPWHYELRPDAVQHGCPARYADAAHDPRMQ